MDLEKRGGVWKQRRGLDGSELSAGGEVVDTGLDPEAALIAKQELEADEAAERGMTRQEYLAWKKEQQNNLDKAA